MTDDELERRFRDARPDGPDDDWTRSPQGRHAWAHLHQRVTEGTSASTPRRLRHLIAAMTPSQGRILVAGGATAIAATLVIGLALVVGGPQRPTSEAGGPAAGGPPADGAVADDAIRPAAYVLREDDSCEVLLEDLRTHARRDPAAYAGGFGGEMMPLDAFAAGDLAMPETTAARTDSHSTTNVQELGIDEQDLVKTNGDRIVSITGGVLRITRTTDHETAASLDLGAYGGSDDAKLLIEGDRALVLLASNNVGFAASRVAPVDGVAGIGTTLVMVDLTDDRPRVMETMRPDGSLVDARLVDGRARVVVSSSTTLATPMRKHGESRADWRKRWEAKVDRTPLGSWLPSYTMSSSGTGDEVHDVACEDVARPEDYSGARMSSVYTIDLQVSASSGFGDVQPVTVVGDGSVAYASRDSLYLTSTSYASRTKTEIHRFDLSGGNAPDYLGSGTVGGWLRDSYALSEYEGVLRVVTTDDGDDSGDEQETSVRALSADTLEVRGEVHGLGQGEDVYGVRYVGPYAYLVTFRQVDPLYVVDLSDPDNPVASGELKVTGYSDYLHMVGSGRLLGVGPEATKRGRVTGAQISLYDVADPTDPTLKSRLAKPRADSSDVADPHAFLYWEDTRTAFVPVRPWSRGWRTSIVAVQVDGNELREIGTIKNPSGGDRYDSGILRTLVIGDEVWTLSSSGLQVSNLDDLTRATWIPFG